MRTLWIFGHQLTLDLEGFGQINREEDTVLMIEAVSRSTWVRYHKKKLVLIFSAMRHFAKKLEAHGYKVDYRQASSFEEGWFAHKACFKPTEVILHMPTDYRMRQLIQKWQIEQSDLNVTTIEESNFLVKEAQWLDLLPDNKGWKLDTVYQKLRKQYAILIDDGKPTGGKWSYDQQNRKPPKKGLTFVEPMFFEPDEITMQVIAEVNEKFPENPGTTDNFCLHVTANVLKGNPRMSMMYRLLEKMEEDDRQKVRQQAAHWLEVLDSGQL